VASLLSIGKISDTVNVTRTARFALDLVFEGMAFEQLHDNERMAVLLIDVVNGADVRMVESRCGAGLAFEPFHRLRIAGEFFRQKLQCDVAPELQVFGFIPVSYTHLTLPTICSV